MLASALHHVFSLIDKWKMLKNYCILLTSNGIITGKQLAKIGKILKGNKRHPLTGRTVILTSFYFFLFSAKYWLKLYNKIIVPDINLLKIKHTSGFSLSRTVTFALKYNNHTHFPTTNIGTRFRKLSDFPYEKGSVCLECLQFTSFTSTVLRLPGSRHRSLNTLISHSNSIKNSYQFRLHLLFCWLQYIFTIWQRIFLTPRFNNSYHDNSHSLNLILSVVPSMKPVKL